MKFLNRNAFLSWESQFEGMWGIFANEPSELRHDVACGTYANVGRCTKSDNDDYPFHKQGTILQYKLFYPFYFSLTGMIMRLGKLSTTMMVLVSGRRFLLVLW